MATAPDPFARARPAPIAEGALLDAAWHRVVQAPGEVRVERIDVTADGDELLVVRQVWWYDEDAEAWELDARDEWWLPPAAALALARSLGDRARAVEASEGA